MRWCWFSHPAMIDWSFNLQTSPDNTLWAWERNEQSLKTSSPFLIPDPPGPPSISGYIEGETIRLGQTVTLVCTSTGGNPLAHVVWLKNGQVIDDSYTTSGLASRNTYTFVAAAEDDHSQFTCESKNKLSPMAMKAEIVLSVQCKWSPTLFPPVGNRDTQNDGLDLRRRLPFSSKFATLTFFPFISRQTERKEELLRQQQSP